MTRILLIISLAAAAAAGPALAATPSFAEPAASITVRLGGKDAKTIKAEIQTAAYQLCRDEFSASLAEFSARLACQRAAVDRAMAQVSKRGTPASFDQALAERTSAR